MEKVLIIGPIPPPYHGVSVMTEMILNSNLQKKFKIVHLDTTDRRSLSNIGGIDFINVYLALKHFLKFLWLCIKERPKIVYVPISQATLGYLRDCLFLIPAKLFHRKVIVHLHGGYFRTFYNQSHSFMKMLIRWTIKDVSRAIILEESLKYIFEGLVLPERIAVVSNGIDDFFKKSELEYFRKVKRYPRILFLSYLARNKGFIDIIEAIPEVLQYYKAAEFVFAGDFWLNEAEKREVDQLINSKSLSQNIKFQGVVTGEEKIKLFISSDIFLLPSYNEGQPLVIIEAMAAGLPIITTNTGAMKEMVIDGENGFIVEKQNPKEIANKIILLLKNERLRKKMGRKSRERFLKYYTKDKFIHGLGRVFEEVSNE